MSQDFVLSEGRYPDVTLWLKKACGAFPDSPEYRLVHDCDDLPGVILAAFARFLGRLRVEGRTDDAAAGFEIENDKEAWGHRAVSTSIRDEFVEALLDYPKLATMFASLLAPRLAARLRRPV